MPEFPPQRHVDAVFALFNQGKLQDVLDGTAELLATYPRALTLHNLRGIAFSFLGQFSSAVESFDHALAVDPDYPDAWCNRGLALQGLKQPAAALASFDRALGLRPDFPEAHSNRGNALFELKRLEEAMAAYDMAIRLRPELADAHNNRGVTLWNLKRLDEALAGCDRALQLKPDYAQAHYNRGNILREMFRLREALASYDMALKIAPRFAEAWNNRGLVLLGMQRREEALESFGRAVMANPDYAEGHDNLGSILMKLGRLEEALDSFDRALQLKPGNANVLALRLHLKAHMCDWSPPRHDCDLSRLGIEGEAVSPFTLLAVDDDPERQMKRAENWTRAQYAAAPALAITQRPRPERLRIGYFSSDYHNHATMYLMARLFELHDKSRFEIHAFSYDTEKPDEMRLRLQGAVDHFHDVCEMTDRDVAELARSNRIDIAVDLKGYTGGTRSGIFAHRAAPVQISYLGYPGTMCAQFMDYILADHIVVPEGAQAFYSERIIRLPHCYQVNDNRREVADTVIGRKEFGLPEHGFVFCCFNNSYKISSAEFDVWMRVLAEVDGSVLWLLRDNAWAMANLRREAEARGIGTARLVFAERVPLSRHLARHRCADLFLDTFNYNAHTTASDALWVGLPVLTRLGKSFPARVGASLLHAVELPELVTTSTEDYRRTALELANDPARLSAIRAKLAASRLTVPLFDTDRFRRYAEAAYDQAYARFAAGLVPDHIEVPA